MKNPALDDDYILEFLMQSHSVNELLDILSNICNNLDLSHLNPDNRHYRYFSVTFFGLVARADSLLEKMLFRSEILRHKMPELNEVHLSLIEVSKKIKHANMLISNRQMRKGRETIMEVAHEYSIIFNRITAILTEKITPK